jgi:hypothetical protein
MSWELSNAALAICHSSVSALADLIQNGRTVRDKIIWHQAKHGRGASPPLNPKLECGSGADFLRYSQLVYKLFVRDVGPSERKHSSVCGTPAFESQAFEL